MTPPSVTILIVSVHRCPPIHSLAGTWAQNIQALHDTSPLIQNSLKAPPPAVSMIADTSKSCLLLASIYSDKTNYGNSLQGYPVHLVCGNGDLDLTNEFLSTNSGIVAFLPVLPYNNALSDELNTQLKSDFLAICLARILRQVKCISYQCLRSTNHSGQRLRKSLPWLSTVS